MVQSIAMYHKQFNLTPIICLHTVKWPNNSIFNNSISNTSFVYTQFKCQMVLFDPLIELYQVLPLRVWVDQGAITVKGYSALPKAREFLELHHQIVLCHIRTFVGRRGHYLFAKIKSVCSIVDWDFNFRFILCQENFVLSYLPIPPLGQNMTQGQFLIRVFLLLD